MRTVADRHRLVAYHWFITSTADDLSEGASIDDLERQLKSKNSQL